MDKIDKPTALYFYPPEIGSDDGARCGICWKFGPARGTCVEVDGQIDPEHGICGLYVFGTPMGDVLGAGRVRRVSKDEAGYDTSGPTHCGNCVAMQDRKVYGTSDCKAVEGTVDGRACCNLHTEVT